MRPPRSAVRTSWAVAAALSLGGALWMFRLGPAVEVDIPAGQTAREVGRILQGQDVIVSPRLFKALAKLTRLDRELKPGVFHLRRRMSSLEALWRLTHDKPEVVKVVIPEGFSARQIAERLEASGVVSARDFLFYAEANHLEGYLYPTTYYFSRGSSAAEAAHRMHQDFNRQVGPVIQGRPNSSLSEAQVVTLASIVQREAVKPEEKPLIAAVYLNRLAKRKPLEADPTVQYALGYWKKGLTLNDLKIDSPYNTYANFGLPPGPICSPDTDSIRAVLDPAKTDALYFVADNTGGHTFNVDYDEHLKAKARAARDRRLRNRNHGR